VDYGEYMERVDRCLVYASDGRYVFFGVGEAWLL
jgi:hypothetical protein